MSLEHKQASIEKNFEPLSALKGLKAGDRLQAKDGTVYEVREGNWTPPIGTSPEEAADGSWKDKEGEPHEVYRMERIEGADHEGKGGKAVTDTHTFNWPHDAEFRQLGRPLLAGDAVALRGVGKVNHMPPPPGEAFISWFGIPIYKVVGPAPDVGPDHYVVELAIRPGAPAYNQLFVDKSRETVHRDNLIQAKDIRVHP